MKTIGQAGAEAALKAMDEIGYQPCVVDMSDIHDIADELERLP